MTTDSIVISIRNLRIHTLIGVYASEREKKQELVLNIRLEIPKLGVPMSDNLCDTVDYSRVAEQLISWARTQQSYLLEHLAFNSMLHIFEMDNRIERIHFEVFKPGCIPNAEGALVELSYSRDELSKNGYARINGRTSS